MSVEIESGPRLKVVIAGATGFVGRALMLALAPQMDVIALSRGHKKEEGVQWRRCDLFSAQETQDALEGADVAVYLVHSMMPSTRLSQASFADMDLLAADNFGRAAAFHDVSQIVFLGGILPIDGGEVSEHLESRLQVEQALAGHGVPVTSLRAGLILGPGGSSARLLTTLVQRLPVLVCPPWTQNKVEPVALKDVLAMLEWALRNPSSRSRIFDVSGPEVLTYKGLLQRTAAAMGLKRRFVPGPPLPLSVQINAVCVATGAPVELVAPLVESLQHSMNTEDHRLRDVSQVPCTPLDEALRSALEETVAVPKAWSGGGAKRRGVRSVQRMTLPGGRTAQWAYLEFLRWAPRATFGVIRVEVSEEGFAFYMRGAAKPLLDFARDEGLCAPDRVVMCIVGGVLAKDHPTDRLEFRQVLGDQLLIAVHDFQPRLWWALYVLTQAPLHLQVMNAFGRHASKQAPLSLV